MHQLLPNSLHFSTVEASFTGLRARIAAGRSLLRKRYRGYNRELKNNKWYMVLSSAYDHNDATLSASHNKGLLKVVQ